MNDDLRHNYLKRRELEERGAAYVVKALDLHAAFLACFDEELPNEADATMQVFLDAMTTRNTIRIDKPMSCPDPTNA